MSLRTLDFIHSPCPRLTFDFLLRLYEHLILIIYPVPDWILIFSFVITNTWFHSFTYFQIKFWSSASLLRILDYIHSPDLRLNFDLLLHHYKTWLHSFTGFEIAFWYSALLLRILDFIHSTGPRLNINRLLCY